MDPIFLGQILLWPGTWPPYGWLFCNGAQYPIGQYQALFSLIGNNYGGNSTVFNVPKLAGITLAGAGNPIAPLMVNYPLNLTIQGKMNQAISASGIGLHTHAAQYNFSPNGLAASVIASADAATSSTPMPNFVPAAGNTNDASVPADIYGPIATPVVLNDAVNAGITSTISSMVVSPSTGTGSPHSNIQPYLALNYIIAVYGDYPPFQ